MGIGNAPAMFVSSTCYDLGQVRADIKNFVESIGIQPILSEYFSFPINPDINTIDNCLKVVDESADLFLLIVGGRYGSQVNNEKSITNLEYIRARAKGIPVYAFVHKSILNILPVWKSNPDGNFQNVVDSPRLFEFVNSLMNIDGIWVFPFELAEDITGTLRKQLAFLFMDALQLRKKIRNTGLPESLLQLDGKSLKFAIEQPPYWEYRLFAHVLAYEISKINLRKLDLRYGLALGKSSYLRDLSEITSWVMQKMDEAARMIDATNQIISVAFKDAIGPDGSPGNPEMIAYVARRLASVYEHAIEWSIECNQVGVGDDECKKLVRLVGAFLENLISEIEHFSNRLVLEIEDAIATMPAESDEIKVVRFVLTISGLDTEEFFKELDRVKGLKEESGFFA